MSFELAYIPDFRLGKTMKTKRKHCSHDYEDMVLRWFSRGRYIWKFVALSIAIYATFSLFFGGEIPFENPGFPLLVAQLGNDHYFTKNIRLSSDAYSRRKFHWEESLVSVADKERFSKLNLHIWDEICGDDLKSLKNHVLFPKYPSRRFFAASTRFSQGIGNRELGERVFGYIHPKLTGTYSFRVSGRPVEVWFSRTSDPTSSRLVYENVQGDWVGHFEFQLVGGNKHYVEILHKQGEQDESFELLWRTPNSSDYVELRGFDISVMLVDNHLGNGEIDGDEQSLQIPRIHQKEPFPLLTGHEQLRNDLHRLPLIKRSVLENVLPECEYKPSYTVDKKIGNNKGIWEMHYNALYPIDNTNVSQDGWVCLGNDALEEKTAMQTVETYVEALNKRSQRSFRLKKILSIEENHDPIKGDRYLLELEVEELEIRQSYRLSEYVFKPKGRSWLCSPMAYHWRRHATVNIVVTVGGRQGRWVQHFINNVADIYRETGDHNLNVIIIDFHCKDIDIEAALKRSGLPRYVLLHMKTKFHKTIGLQYAMNIVTDPNDIVFVCDLHLFMPVTIIDHIRKHCIQGKTAFNPLLVRLDCGYTANNPHGRWEHDGFGPMATFKSDWDRFGGMNVEKFKHSWGGEDWDMVDRILSAGYEIDRLKILNFFHFYHSKKGMWKESEA